MYSYKNGSYTVMILDDGTKIRYNKFGIYKPNRVESMDIKITNKCDMGCMMCHENSTPMGEEANLLDNPIIDSIPPYTELAIGGGNPLSHKDLVEFLVRCKNKNLICNITVNKKHFLDSYDYIKTLFERNLISSIGVSVFDITEKEIEEIKSVNSVCHVIVGVTPIEVMYQLANKNVKVLVLGYKTFRRGADYYQKNNSFIDTMQKTWAEFISNAIKYKFYSVLSFDNLAIKQLLLKENLSQEEWDSFFMGDDGIDGEFSSASMYIDLVNWQFAENSCTPIENRGRCSLYKNNVNDMFNSLLKKTLDKF